MMPDDNPFASPQAEVGAVAAEDVEQSEARRIRQKHLSHEASVKSIGTLYYLGFGILALVAIGSSVSFATFTFQEGVGAPELAIMFAVCAFYFGLAVLNFYVGWGLKRLDSGARIVAGVLSGLGLLAIPIGTLINAYFLYLLFSRKGTTVFSAEYRDVIQQTPDMRYKTSWVVIVFAVLFAACLVVAFVAMLMGSS